MENQKLSREMGVFACITYAIGAIVGAGVFSLTGIGISMAGRNLPLAFVVAAVLVLFLNLPMIYQAGAVPVTAGQTVYISRFLHPTLGWLQILTMLLQSLIAAFLSIIFSLYFMQLFPGFVMGLDGLIPGFALRIISVSVLVLFAFFTTRGIKIAGWLQSVFVVIMVIAIAIYIIPGLGKVQPQYNTLSEAFIPAAGVAGIWGAVAILRNTVEGASSMFNMGEEFKNPRKTIPIGYVVGTLSVAVIYGFMAYVTTGVMPVEEMAGQDLSVSAGVVLGSGTAAFNFFIVGGALLAILTSLMSLVLSFSRILYSAAQDKVLPSFFGKLNKHGTPAIATWCIVGAWSIIVLLGVEFEDLVKIVTVPALLLSFINYASPLMVEKKLPNCHKKAWFKFKRPVLIVLCALSSVITFTLGISVFSDMKTGHWIGCVIYYALGMAYWVWRTKYVRKTQGVDLIEKMGGLDPSWIEMENSETAE